MRHGRVPRFIDGRGDVDRGPGTGLAEGVLRRPAELAAADELRPEDIYDACLGEMMVGLLVGV